MQTALIICNGNKPRKEQLNYVLADKPTIICANGGTKHAVALGLMPDVVIGDLDSLPQSLKKQLEKSKVPILAVPPHPKYHTDAELAIEYALKKKFGKIYVCGVYGSRVDQSFATILHIAKQQLRDRQFVILEDRQVIFVVNKTLTLVGKKGEVFSLIPLRNNTTGVTITGAKYELKNGTIPYGSTLGISNEFLAKHIKITLKKGTVLIIHSQRNG